MSKRYPSPYRTLRRSPQRHVQQALRLLKRGLHRHERPAVQRVIDAFHTLDAIEADERLLRYAIG